MKPKEQVIAELIHMAEVAGETEKAKEDLQFKKTALEKKRVDAEYQKMVSDEVSLEIVEATNFGAMSVEQIEREAKEMEEYFEAAKNRMQFINKYLDDYMPLFRKNLVVIGAKTGNGKTQALANTVHSVLTQKNPQTGKGRRALVITNEETTIDIYNRITCLVKGWDYVNHEAFTQEQRDVMKMYFKALASKGSLIVVDDNFNGASGVTKTVEGIEKIFETLIANNEWYDVVILDYYQNVNSSSKNPRLDQFKVQEQLSFVLDKYKNIYPAPIIVFSQLKSTDPGEETEEGTPFELRLKGSKSILVPCTHAMELISDHQNHRSVWKVHKSRYRPKTVGAIFYTGFDRGRFVAYDEAFKSLVAQKKAAYSEKAQEKLLEKTEEKKNQVK